MKANIQKKLITLFEIWSKEELESSELLPISGSVRQYIRLISKNKTAIGCFNDNYKENSAFLSYAQQLKSAQLPVPKIYADQLDDHIYLQEDLGDLSFYDHIDQINRNDEGNLKISILYKSVINHLIEFQFKGHEVIDYSKAYPRSKFDKQSMLWDMNYFKHFFIKLAGVSFHEQDLEDDFRMLVNYLLSTDTNYFMFRDFQSRNIMINNDEFFFIDFQGGRQGALQYDLASLLYDAKANLTIDQREELLNYYMLKLSEKMTVDKAAFRNYYYAYVLIRVMQAFGAYGYRGFFERKQHFLLSIPYALNNLKYLMDKIELPIKLPALYSVFDQLIHSPNLNEFNYKPKPGLTVLINSFSYKRSIPLDNSGNGGGFVFDCRFLPNPGRLKEFKELTGKDQEVIDYLSPLDEVQQFINQVENIVSCSIQNYLDRKFNHLMISFGCTGGQHRSVFCANQLAKHFADNKHINLELRHVEMEIQQKI